MPKKAHKQKEAKGNRVDELNDLRTWIEEQMNIEHNQPQPEAHEEQQNNEVKERKAGRSQTTTIPGNSLIPLEDELKQTRPNRYGLQGDNGYGDIVKAQRAKEGLSEHRSQQENILDFT